MFVAVDKQGKTIAIPELIPQTEGWLLICVDSSLSADFLISPRAEGGNVDEKLLYAEAEQRRQLRAKMKAISSLTQLLKVFAPPLAVDYGVSCRMI